MDVYKLFGWIERVVYAKPYAHYAQIITVHVTNKRVCWPWCKTLVTCEFYEQVMDMSCEWMDKYEFVTCIQVVYTCCKCPCMRGVYVTWMLSSRTVGVEWVGMLAVQVVHVVHSSCSCINAILDCRISSKSLSAF